MKEENQKLLSENKWCYIITEYPGDCFGFERTRIYYLEKPLNDVLLKWFKKECKKIEWENTISEQSQHKPVKSFVHLRCCKIKYDDELERFIIDYENGFSEMGEYVKGKIFAEEEED